jgi:hypothetical protein
MPLVDQRLLTEPERMRAQPSERHRHHHAEAAGHQRGRPGDGQQHAHEEHARNKLLAPVEEHGHRVGRASGLVVEVAEDAALPPVQEELVLGVQVEVQHAHPQIGRHPRGEAADREGRQVRHEPLPEAQHDERDGHELDLLDQRTPDEPSRVRASQARETLRRLHPGTARDDL